MLQSVIVRELRLVLACYSSYCRGAQTGFGMLQSVIVAELRLVLAYYSLLLYESSIWFWHFTVCYCRGAQTGFGMLQSIIVG